MPAAKSVAREVFAFLFLIGASGSGALNAEQVPVRYAEGLTHGFLLLRDTTGNILADGDLQQTSKGSRVTTIVTFRFKDGSFYQDTTIFSQRRVFRLLTDHLVQKGPSFDNQDLDSFIDAPRGEVIIRSMENGKEKVSKQHFDLPPDLCNGLIFVLLKNIRPGSATTSLPMLALSSKPRLVKLEISTEGERSFALGLISQKATHFVIKIKIAGIAGVVAPLIGKEPPDLHVWIISGGAPVFVRSEGPFFEGGPIWTIEFAAPEQGTAYGAH